MGRQTEATVPLRHLILLTGLRFTIHFLMDSLAEQSWWHDWRADCTVLL